MQEPGYLQKKDDILLWKLGNHLIADKTEYMQKKHDIHLIYKKVILNGLQVITENKHIWMVKYICIYS